MKRVSQGRSERSDETSAAPRVATIYDVAREAGVSPASVSRVVNGTARVSADVAERVRLAIAKVDFHPYDLAVGRARRTMGIVGLVIPDVTNPFWAEVAMGAEEALQPHGYGLMLSNAGDSLEREEDVISLLRRKRADGALVSAMRNASKALHRLRDAGTAVVLLGLGADDGTFDLVTTDGGQGIYLTTTHLLDIGHRRVAFVGGPPDQATNVARRAGYQRALTDRGVTPLPAWVAEGPGWGYESGSERVRELLARHVLDGPDRVTALVAANDILAFGALAALDGAGRQVPEDVSLTGFDDLPLATLCRPPLTTAAQFSRERGRIAARVLLERMTEKGAAPAGQKTGDPTPRRIVLEPKLVVRASTRTPDQERGPASRRPHQQYVEKGR